MIVTIALIVLTMSATGCDMFSGKSVIDQAQDTLDQGNTALAIKQGKSWLNMNPRNIWAKRFLKKIEAQLIEEGRSAMQAEQYGAAATKADLVLNKLNPKSPEALAIQANAKKHLRLQSAKKNLAADNPVGALRFIKEALKFDPNFQEAKDLQVKANQQVEEKIANLMGAAQGLYDRGEYKKLRKLAQDILTIAPQNREIAAWLRKAQAAILEGDKAKNLELARKFFDEGIYESAKKKAEKVLKVDPNNADAKKIVEDANAEITRPGLKLVAFTKIKSKEYATIKMGKERFTVVEGEVFAEIFKVSAIDYDLKAVVVTYIKTSSQQTLTIGDD